MRLEEERKLHYEWVHKLMWHGGGQFGSFKFFKGCYLST